MVLHSWMIYLYTPRITNNKSELKKILKKKRHQISSEIKKGKKKRKKTNKKQKTHYTKTIENTGKPQSWLDAMNL